MGTSNRFVPTEEDQVPETLVPGDHIPGEVVDASGSTLDLGQSDDWDQPTQLAPFAVPRGGYIPTPLVRVEDPGPQRDGVWVSITDDNGYRDVVVFQGELEALRYAVGMKDTDVHFLKWGESAYAD